MRCIEEGDRRLFVVAGRSRHSKEDILSAVGQRYSGADEPPRLLRADRVFGLDHITSAFQKALRAFRNGENSSDSLVTETMLYMSGGRQIQDAIDLFRLHDELGGLVCIAADEPDLLSRLCEEIGLDEDDRLLLEFSDREIGDMGITDTALSTVPGDSRKNLVLEKVAAVDINKR